MMTLLINIRVITTFGFLPWREISKKEFWGGYWEHTCPCAHCRSALRPTKKSECLTRLHDWIKLLNLLFQSIDAFVQFTAAIEDAARISMKFAEEVFRVLTQRTQLCNHVAKGCIRDKFQLVPNTRRNDDPANVLRLNVPLHKRHFAQICLRINK